MRRSRRLEDARRQLADAALVAADARDQLSRRADALEERRASPRT
jgi:hypothetical protein